MLSKVADELFVLRCTVKDNKEYFRALSIAIDIVAEKRRMIEDLTEFEAVEREDTK